jgi:hypothetical protein
VTAIQPAPSPDAWGVVSRMRRDDELVLATQMLKPGTDETTLSRFGDDRWDLAPAVFRENSRMRLRPSTLRRSPIPCSA